jgi:hypothetical protein
MEERKRFWDGWLVDGDFLLDPAGNHYHRNEIRAIFFDRQLIRELRGSDLKIYSLKQELERKLELMKPPIVIIQWPNREIRLAHPYNIA